MTDVESGRRTHGASRTVGGSGADWLVGGGVLALLVAAFGMWGPQLSDWRASSGHPAERPSAVRAPLEETPLATLAPLEAPVPPTAQPGRDTGMRRTEPLQPEVSRLLDSPQRGPVIEARQADGFIRADSVLRLPAPAAGGKVTLDALAERLSADPAATVTVRQEVVATQPRRLVDLLQQAAQDTPGDPAPRPLEQLAQQLLQTAPEGDDPAALSRLSRQLSSAGIDPQARFDVDVDGGRSSMQLVELLAGGHLVDAQATIAVIEKGTTVASLTLADLEAARSRGVTEVELVEGTAGDGRTTTIEALLGGAGDPADTIYFVRTVQPDDAQGVWGIVQQGVMTTFAQGVRLGEDDSAATVRLDIPPDADELEGRRSSFLGRLIARKVDASWVYNLEDGRMGRNPHLVYPGQELVIVGFQPAELNDIYRHFSQAAVAAPAPLSHR
jgi:hypothetical protein